jgi:hypothetical protein
MEKQEKPLDPKTINYVMINYHTSFASYCMPSQRIRGHNENQVAFELVS